MDIYTFRMRGLVYGPKWSDEPGDMGREKIKKIYIFESTSFQKAVTKAKKVFLHIHSVEQMHGEILEQ